MPLAAAPPIRDGLPLWKVDGDSQGKVEYFSV